MPLSEYEQRVLEQMERQLSSDDPRLVHTLAGRTGSPLRRWLIAGAGGVVGLGLLVAGAATSLAWLGIAGFVAMVGAVLYAVTPRRGGPAGVVREDGTVAPRPSPSARPRGGPTGFLARMEARWDKRREGQG